MDINRWLTVLWSRGQIDMNGWTDDRIMVKGSNGHKWMDG